MFADLFGSYSRGEDVEESDIDLFVEAKERNLDIRRFEKALGRKMQLHFKEDINLFPKEYIKPSYGYGKRIRQLKKIQAYQLDKNVCPHLDRRNFCNIYSTRPRACKAFPLISGGPLGTFVAPPNECKYFEKRRIHGSDFLFEKFSVSIPH